jgi:hypothetical protein
MRRKSDGTFKIFAAAVCSVAALIIIGYIILLLNPPTDLDRKCLKSSAYAMSSCVMDYYRETGGRK